MTLEQLLQRSELMTALLKGMGFGAQYYRNGKTTRRSKQLCEEAANSYLDSHEVRKLQIGAGPNPLDGWFNTDLEPDHTQTFFLDATHPLPFSDHTFDYIFSEHFIEHITYLEGFHLLRECRRVLKPGGKIRVATPNAENIVGLYDKKKTELQRRYIRWSVDQFLSGIASYRESFVVNHFYRAWGHQFIYDKGTLQDALEASGFINIVWQVPGQSNDQNLRGIEYHGRVIGEEMNNFETMVLEAQAPA